MALQGQRGGLTVAAAGCLLLVPIAALQDGPVQDELLAFCAGRLADYKRPRTLWFVDELPRNATGKVMKHKLRDIAQQ